ncbi:putative phospholipid-transporting ATPase IM, partial [Caligus rogercresseyi]
DILAHSSHNSSSPDGVLSLTAIKDAYDDIQRHQTDRQVNNRKSKVLRKGQLVAEKWHRVE